MVQLNRNNITNQYLYGQLTTPTNLADDSLIRSKDATTEVEVDVVEFMATGAGRFAVGSQFEQVSKFTDVIFSNGFVQVVNTSRLHHRKVNH